MGTTNLFNKATDVADNLGSTVTGDVHNGLKQLSEDFIDHVLKVCMQHMLIHRLSFRVMHLYKGRYPQWLHVRLISNCVYA